MLAIHIRLLTVVLCICGTPLALVLFLVHSAPLPDFGNGVAMCDVPCWAGIEPGRTAFADSRDTLMALFPDAELSLSQDRIDFDVLSTNVIGVLWADQPRVDKIYANVSQPLWTALLTLDAPQCIQYIDSQLLPEMIIIFWRFDDVYVMASVFLTRSDPEAMTDSILLWQSPPESPCATSDNVAPWPGYFALK